jgi:hypothetical protein
VKAIPALADAYRSGVPALRQADRSRIVCANTRRLKGSVDVDAALVDALPNDPRWDYGIGHYNGRTEEAVWVEVHPASSDHVSHVTRKAQWLRQWLTQNAAPLLGMTREADGYVWLSAGTVSIQRGSRQARALAMAGVSFPRRRLELS